MCWALSEGPSAGAPPPGPSDGGPTAPAHGAGHGPAGPALPGAWDRPPRPGMGGRLLGGGLSDTVSVTNRVQNRAHAKNQPRFYV